MSEELFNWDQTNFPPFPYQEEQGPRMQEVPFNDLISVLKKSPNFDLNLNVSEFKNPRFSPSVSLKDNLHSSQKAPVNQAWVSSVRSSFTLKSCRMVHLFPKFSWRSEYRMLFIFESKFDALNEDPKQVYDTRLDPEIFSAYIETPSFELIKSISQSLGLDEKWNELKEETYKNFKTYYHSLSESSITRLRWFYEVAPAAFLVSQLSDEIKLNDLSRLLNIDIRGFLHDITDTTQSFYNCLTAISDRKRLYNRLMDDPTFIKESFEAADIAHRLQLVTVYSTLAYEFGSEQIIETENFVSYTSLTKFDSDLIWGEDGRFNIEYKTPPNDDFLGTAFLFYHGQPLLDQYSLKGKLNNLHPFDWVVLVNSETGESIYVTALNIKQMAVIQEWEEILQIGALILAFAVFIISAYGVAFASTLFFEIIVAIETGIAGVALVLSIPLVNQSIKSSPEGREFIENFQTFELYSGLAFFSVGVTDNLINSYVRFLVSRQKSLQTQVITELINEMNLLISRVRIALWFKKSSQLTLGTFVDPTTMTKVLGNTIAGPLRRKGFFLTESVNGKHQVLFGTRNLIVEGDINHIKKILNQRSKKYGSFSKYIEETVKKQKILDELRREFTNKNKSFQWARLLKNPKSRILAEELGISYIHPSRFGIGFDASKGDGLKLLFGKNITEGNVLKIKSRYANKPQTSDQDMEDCWPIAKKFYGWSDEELKLIKKEFVWHHLDDFDPETGEYTLQLINRKFHAKLVPHVGKSLELAYYNRINKN